MFLKNVCQAIFGEHLAYIPNPSTQRSSIYRAFGHTLSAKNSSPIRFDSCAIYLRKQGTGAFANPSVLPFLSAESLAIINRKVWPGNVSRTRIHVALYCAVSLPLSADAAVDFTTGTRRKTTMMHVRGRSDPSIKEIRPG